MLIAINRNIVNKASTDDLKRHNSTFENTDLPVGELAALIDRGFAFCSQHKNNRRSSINFLCAGFLAVDIDHGLTLETVKEDSYFQQYASLLYTTPSHTAEAHRFRIVFELEEPIADKETMRDALTGLIGRFGAGGSCKDPCRLFFGSSGSEPIVYANRLPASEVEALVIRGRELGVRTDTAGEQAIGKFSPVRSRLVIPKGTVVRSAHDSIGKIEDIPDQTQIYCPQHVDMRANQSAKH